MVLSHFFVVVVVFWLVGWFCLIGFVGFFFNIYIYIYHVTRLSKRPICDPYPHKSFCLNLLMVGVTEPWHRLPRESPSLEIFISFLDTVLGNMLIGDPV